ncbi:MAG: hypothetical protein H6581_22215 [Bacteroidia bacterium]|nr:hypothetical protein [Bacteroidia bacterium]
MAGILFLLGSGILTFLALWLDDTTYGTGNGLWKAVWIRDYIEKGVDFSHLQELSYVSNLLYFPVYAAISQILPSGLAMVTKMAIINAWFAGLAGAAFYVLAFLLTQNWKAALGGFLFHLAGANFLTCSTNSEDIIPAYAFFVWSLVFLVLYLQRPVYQWLLLTAFCYALSWGFHWTMAIGPAPAFLLALLWRQESWRKALTDLILFATVNLMAITAAWIIFGVPPDLMIYPNKGEGGAWLGFALEKFPLLYSGMALYVLGGFQFNGLEIFLETIQNRWYGPEFVFSSLILIISLLVSIVWWRKKRKVKGVRIFNWYLVALFFFAQLMNVYEFGTDLQFHIQPMIWLPIAWVLLLDSLTSKSWPSWLKTGLSCLIGIAIPLFMLGWNVGKFRLPTQGKDHFYLAQIAKVDEKVEDFSNMFWLTRGWDDFRNWGYAQWGEKFRAHTYVLVDYLADRPDESVKEACARLRETIENELDQGKIVIAGPEIIDREAWEIVDTFSGFGQREKCEALLKTVREEFSREVWVKTEMGNFYRLGRGTSPSAL